MGYEDTQGDQDTQHTQGIQDNQHDQHAGILIQRKQGNHLKHTGLAYLERFTRRARPRPWGLMAKKLALALALRITV